MATKPTAEQAAKRILWLMVHKLRIREGSIAHQGQFLTIFPRGAFHSGDFKHGVDYAVSKGWVEVAKMGSIPALRLTTAGFAAAPDTEGGMETTQSRALRLLAALYDRTRDAEQPIDASDLAPELGISFDEATGAWRYLSDRGLIKTFGAAYFARINANGIDAIEKARQHPDESPPGFGSVTYNTINIHHMQDSSIQQAGSHSGLVQTTTYSAQDISELHRALDTLEQHIDDLGLDAGGKKKALAQIATIKAQLTDEPNPIIVKQAGKTLRNITEGAIGGLIASAIQPGIWQFVGNVFARFFGG